MDQFIRISHWLPIVTFCPVNGVPNFLYITVVFKNQFRELYSVRKEFKRFQFSKCFMEDIADDLTKIFPDAVQVTVRLVTGRHIVIVRK